MRPIYKLILLLPCLMAFTVTLAQEKQSSIVISGMGGPHFRMSTVGDRPVTLWGGAGGMMINNRWMFGGGGYGSMGSATYNGAKEIAFGYGGLIAEYNPLVRDRWNLNLNALVGWGGVSYRLPVTLLDGQPAKVLVESSTLTVLEPGLSAEFKTSDFMKISIGGMYRFMLHSDVPLLSDGDMSGPVAEIAFRFGYFGGN